MTRARILWFATAIAALVIVLRVPALFVPILNEDEAIYATTAAAMATGEPMYRAGVESKPPGIFYLYRAAFAVVGRYNMRGVHALTIPWVLVTTLLVGLLGYYAGGDRPAAGLWAALLYAVFSTVHEPKILATQCELVYGLPLTAAAIALVRAPKASARGRLAYSFFAGVAIACGTIIKPTAGTLLGATLFAALLTPGARKDALVTLAGFVTMWLLTALHFAHLGVLPDLAYWSLYWTVGHYIPAGYTDRAGLRRIFGSLIPWLALALLLWTSAVIAVKRELTPARLFLALWAAFAFGSICLGGRFYDHYFPQIIPPLAALGGFTLANAWATRNRALQSVIAFLLVVPAALCLLASATFEYTNRLLGENRPSAAALSAYLRANTTPDERAFVWGYYPLIYVGADRLAATRFVGCHYLTGYAVLGLARKIPPAAEDKLAVPHGFDDLFADFAKHPPAIIMDTAPADLHHWANYPLSRYPRLLTYITENYEKRAVVDGVVIYHRRVSLDTAGSK